MRARGIVGRLTLALAALGAAGLCAGLAAATQTHAGAASPAASAPAVTQVPPEERTLALKPDETLKAGLLRAGLSAADANAALAALSDSYDTVNPRRDVSLRLSLRRAGGAGDPPRLETLSVSQGARPMATLTRTAAGALQAQAVEDAPAPPPPAGAAVAVREEPAVIDGPMERVLYGVGADAAPDVILVQAARLFAHKLDLARDIQLGDRVRLVYNRRVDAQGQAVAPGELLYAEITGQGRTTRFYRHQSAVSVGSGLGVAKAEYLDDGGVRLSSSLLRTPVSNPRVTSGFGMRMHPLLGYTRMHRGVDFGAPIGTPVVAAGEGVVEEVRWAGGYGRWIKLRHAGVWETGYGHLSAWAAGLRAGERVAQGQVIGYVGSSGLSTGPHLHYEVYRSGEAIDPRLSRPLTAPDLPGRDLAAFQGEKTRIAALLARAHPGAARVAANGPGGV